MARSKRIERRGRRLLGLVAVMLLAVAAVGFGIVNQQPPDLLKLARKVADASDWDHNRYSPTMSYYWWLSDREALGARDTQKGVLRFFRRDVATQREIRLLWLDRQFAKSYAEIWELQVSPDGRWALWGGPDSADSVAVSLDGLHLMRVPFMKDSQPHWMADSRHWINLVFEWGPQKWTHGLLYDVQEPKRPPVLLTIPPQNQPGRGGVDMAPDGRMRYFSDWHKDRYGFDSLTFCEAGIGPNAAPKRQYPTPLPGGAEVMECEWSPDGKRMVWLLKITRWTPVSTLLHRFFPKVKLQKKTQWSLWVSRFDGAQMREIGSFPLKEAKGRYKKATNVRWLPSGKRISFLYGNSLWTVPAD